MTKKFEIGTEYTGYFEESKKKCKVKIVSMDDKSTTLKVSTIKYNVTINTKSILRTFDDVERIRFYHSKYYNDGGQRMPSWIIVWADNRLGTVDVAETPFFVGRTYVDGKFTARCVRRTEKYATFYIDQQECEKRAYIQTYCGLEICNIPSCLENTSHGLNSFRAIYLRSDDYKKSG